MTCKDPAWMRCNTSTFWWGHSDGNQEPMPEHKTMQGESKDWLILKLIYASLKVQLAHRWPIIGNYLVLSYLLQDTDDNVSLTFFCPAT